MIGRAKKITKLHRLSGRRPPSAELDAHYTRFFQASQNNQWDTITSLDWKIAPWLLWHKDPFLADQASFMEQFHHVLVNSDNGGMWKMIIHAYLLHYGTRKENPSSEQQVAQWLQEACDAPAYKDSLSIWRERNQTIGMFDDASWLKHAAQRYLTDYNAEPKAYWKAFGLTGELETSGYSTVLGREILKQIRTMLASRPVLIDSAWRYVMKDEVTARFPTLRRNLIETMLAPWIEIAPPDEIRHAFTARILAAFHDPRLPEAAEHWDGVRDAAILVFLRWLEQKA